MCTFLCFTQIELSTADNYFVPVLYEVFNHISQIQCLRTSVNPVSYTHLLEPGPDGGLVMLDDTTVLDRALKILDEINMSMQKEQATEPMQI